MTYFLRNSHAIHAFRLLEFTALLGGQGACAPGWGKIRDVHRLLTQEVSVRLAWHLQADASGGLFKGYFDFGLKC